MSVPEQVSFAESRTATANVLVASDAPPWIADDVEPVFLAADGASRGRVHATPPSPGGPTSATTHTMTAMRRALVLPVQKGNRIGVSCDKKRGCGLLRNSACEVNGLSIRIELVVDLAV